MMDRAEMEALRIEASDPETTAQRLEALIEIESLRVYVAANPSAPAHVLTRLSKRYDREVQRALAANPNTPLTVLTKLIVECPHEFLQNPLLPMLQLVQPDYFHIKYVSYNNHLEYGKPTFAAFLQLLRCEELPVEIAKQFGRGSATADKVLQALVNMHVGVVGEVTGLPREREQELQGTVQWKMFADIDDLVEVLVLLWPRVAEQLIDKLATGNFVRAKTVAVKHHLALTDEEWVRLIEQSSLDHLESLVQFGVLPEMAVSKALARIGRQLESFIHKGTDMSQREADDYTRLIRVLCALLRNKGVSQQVLQHYATHPDVHVRMTVVGNPRSAVGDKVSSMEDNQLRVRAMLALQYGLPEEVYVRLASDVEVVVRSAVARNARVPFRVLSQLTTDVNETVRKRALRNPRYQRERLEELLSERSVMESGKDMAAADLASDSVEGAASAGLVDLAADSAGGSSSQVGSRQADLPTRMAYMAGVQRVYPSADQLEESVLEYPKYYATRRLGEMLRHPALRERKRALLLLKLWQTLRRIRIREETFFSVLLDMEQLPVELLAIIARADAWQDRCRVARYNEIPRWLLRELTHDGNRYVRCVAREELEQRYRKRNRKPRAIMVARQEGTSPFGGVKKFLTRIIGSGDGEEEC